MTGWKALTKAQWRSFWRDKQTIFWTFAFPLMFLLLFGFIFRDAGADKRDLVQVGSVSIIDQMPAPARESFDAIFTVTKTDDEATALQMVRDGKSAAAVSMTGTEVVVRYSQADPVRAAQVQGALEAFVQSANVAAAGKPPTFTTTRLSVEDQSLKLIEVMAPGLLGWAIAMGAIFGSAMPFVQWRTTKLLRRLRLAPVGVASVITSRAAVTMVVALLQTAVFLALGILVFGMRLRGSWWLAIPVILLATLAFMSLGLIVGAVSKTVESASGLANVIVMPMAFLSGSFISLASAPPWLVTVSTFMPLRHLNDAMIDVMVRGKGVDALAVPTAVLCGFALVCSVLAVRLFRWEDKAG